MLTKDLLKFRVNRERLYPSFLDPQDPKILGMADGLLTVLEESAESTFSELEEALDAVIDSSQGQNYAAGFKKLIFDSCDGEVDETLVQRRRELLHQAEALRRSQAFSSIEAFQEALTSGVGLSFSTIRESLYADLPAHRKITSFKRIAPEAFVHRYNCALVQGHLIRAKSLTLTLQGSSLAERRALMRQLKFHRLLAEIEGGGAEGLTLKLSGPLNIFQNAQSYGLRLAAFFPHVLNCRQWQLNAEVEVKNKKMVKLQLDESSGIKSHYSVAKPYVPPELTSFLEHFNEKSKIWQAKPAQDFVDIGRQSYCFPDITLSSNDGRRVHVELFHRWHIGQLDSRLKSLERNPVSELFIGVNKTLSKNEKVAGSLEKSSWFKKYGFIFGEFPTPKGLLALLP